MVNRGRGACLATVDNAYSYSPLYLYNFGAFYRLANIENTSKKNLPPLDSIVFP